MNELPGFGRPAAPPLVAMTNRDDWSDTVRSQLFQRRVVFLSGPLTTEAGGRCAMEVMTLDASGDDAIDLQLESSDGELDAALALMDVIELAGVPVRVTALGLVGGPAVGVLAVGAHRMAMPHTRFRLAESSSSFTGHARDVQGWAEHVSARADVFCARLAAAVGQPAERVEADLAVTRFLDAHQAKRYGLVDEILSAGSRVVHLPPRPMGFGGM